mgnify:FL=1
MRYRQLVSFFNDIKITDSDPAIPAALYFATKGFFNDYDARLNEPLTQSVQAAWEQGLQQLEQGTLEPRQLAKQVQQAEEQKSPATTVKRGNFLLNAWDRMQN